MSRFYRIIAVCLVMTVTFAMMGASPVSVSAETIPMTWKPMDKAYITLIVDDNNEQLQRMYDVVCEEYDFPLCVAVPVKSYSSAANSESLELLHKIQDNGGEILSHNLTHKVFNRSVPWTTVDYELGESYRQLSAQGFLVNGVIGCGGGGAEDDTEEYRAELEKYTSKYYKYSDYYGVSTQYNKSRNWIAAGWSTNKRIIDNAITNKGWEVLAWHHFPDVFGTNLTEAGLRKVLDYLKQKQQEGVLEVIIYRDVHKKFADWASPVDLDTIPPVTTTTSTTTVTTTTSTTTVKSRPSRTAPTFLTTTTTATSSTPDVSEPQAPDSSAPEAAPAVDADADRPTGEKDATPWIPWVIIGAAVAACTAGAITAAFVWRKKHRH